MLQQERNIVYEAVPPAQETQPAPDTREYSSTYTVISKVAYLIGVPKKFFEAEYAPPQLQTFDQMEREKNARIIRDLCRLRTAIEQNYGRINKAFLYDLKNLHTLPEYIPQECLHRLSEDGIELLRANYKLTQYIIDINLHIANRINNCRDLLPLWLKWEYVRELFLMPNGTKEAGLKRAAEEYCANRTHYPYQVYINWPAQEEQGNILHNDKKFITLLYEMHEDYFADLSKVSDAGSAAKAGIYQFLEGSRRTAIVVDCENSDPYKLYAMLNNLDQNALLGKIAKIILYDDVHTTTAWQILENADPRGACAHRAREGEQVPRGHPAHDRHLLRVFPEQHRLVPPRLERFGLLGPDPRHAAGALFRARRGREVQRRHPQGDGKRRHRLLLPRPLLHRQQGRVRCVPFQAAWHPAGQTI